MVLAALLHLRKHRFVSYDTASSHLAQQIVHHRRRISIPNYTPHPHPQDHTSLTLRAPDPLSYSFPTPSHSKSSKQELYAFASVRHSLKYDLMRSCTLTLACGYATTTQAGTQNHVGLCCRFRRQVSAGPVVVLDFDLVYGTTTACLSASPCTSTQTYHCSLVWRRSAQA